MNAAGLIFKQKRITNRAMARKRLDEGRLGWCAECQGDIDLERLEAEPEATLSLNCHAKRQK